MFSNCCNWISTLLLLLTFHNSHTISVFVQPKDKFEFEARQILDRHNQYRKCHQVPPLTIDPKLNKDAQNLANALSNNQIDLSEAHKWRHGNVLVTPWNQPLADLFRENEKSMINVNPVDRWYDEIKFYYDDKSKTDHFSRIVWKESKKLGVGISRNAKGLVYIVCMYDPEGNIPGLYAENVILPDEKTIHATDICMLPQMTSPSKAKGNTTSTTPKTSSPKMKTSLRTSAEADIYTSTSHNSSTSTEEGLLASLRTGSMTSTPPTSVASLPMVESDSMTSLQIGPSTSVAPSPITSIQTGSLPSLKPSSVNSGQTASTLITRLVSSRILPSLSTQPPSFSDHPGLTTPATVTTTPIQFGMTTLPPFISSQPSNQSTNSIDILPNDSSLPEAQSDGYVSMPANNSTLSTTLAPISAPSWNTSHGHGFLPCNMSGSADDGPCILPEAPSTPNHHAPVPTSGTNQTTNNWLDPYGHEFANQTDDITVTDNMDKQEKKAEYLKFSLIFMGLLISSLSILVASLALFSLFRIFVCCSRRRNSNGPCLESLSMPAAQTPSNVMSIIPTTNPHPISPSMSRPASPIFQRTAITRLY